MRPLRSLALVLLAFAAPGAVSLLAQEEPLAAGSDGVPVPKKTKHVQPTYPQEALAQGVRGIVIIDIVVDTQGKVESTSIVRSVPGLDEAAIAAARQWEYEPTKVNGKPVRVRITVPITFSLALPSLARQEGVPELRQGVAPVWPPAGSGNGRATAEVTLEPDGRIGVARVLEGDPPWSDALLAALRTWRFAPPPEDAVLSFRVEAEFTAARGSDARKVSLRAGGLQRSGFIAESSPPQTPAAAPASPPAPVAPATGSTTTPAPPAGTPAPPVPPPAAPAPAAPAPSAPTPPAPAPTASAPTASGPAAPPARPATPPATTAPADARAAGAMPGPVSPAVPGATPAGPSQPAGAAAPPPVEVLTAPPPPLPPENGVSAIRDVSLEPGVPDLTRGRRPVSPPLARMTGTTGTVEVAFSVSAGGVTSVQSTSGPDLLKPAAEQAVASWVFRRARADRAYLVAVFTYAQDKSTVVVRPQAAPPTAEPAGPTSPPRPPAPQTPTPLRP
jgi:TonB family protein